MSNALINLEETGSCRCGGVGKRARGARDIELTAERTNVFRKTFYCENCLTAAAQRVLSSSIAIRARRRIGEGSSSARVTWLGGDAGRDELF